MKISIVIPAFNEAKLLPRTLAAVSQAKTALTRRAWESETVVCDNNSTDETAAIAQAAGARITFEPVNQIGRARNTGAQAATGNWIIFVDADSEPSVALFSAVADRIAAGRVLGGGALIALDSGPIWIHALAEVWGLYSVWRQHMAGAFIFVETAAFRELGGFSSELFAGEELEFSQRLKRLARQQRRTVEILRNPRLRTSARKANLYSPKETFRFLLRLAWRPRKTLGNREECSIWYDGRR